MGGSLSFTFSLVDFVSIERMWPVTESVCRLNEGLLHDVQTVEHHHQLGPHVVAEDVPVLTPPLTELGPGVPLQQEQVAQQGQGGPGARREAGRTTCGQPVQQGQGQHSGHQHACRLRL